ncbi:MAG: hypothetical protein ABI687_10130 [Flavitalea sp.]
MKTTLNLLEKNHGPRIQQKAEQEYRKYSTLLPVLKKCYGND